MITEHNEQVRHLLQRYPETRDSDQKLFCLFLKQYLYGKFSKPGVASMPTETFLDMLYQGQLPNWETVSRCRRKLQETEPDLRGKKYYERKGMEDQVKQELGYPAKTNEYEHQMSLFQ